MTLAGLARDQEERVVRALERGLSRDWLGVSGSHQGRRWSGKLIASAGRPELSVLFGDDGPFVATTNAKLAQIAAGELLEPPGPRPRLSALAG
jgi:hypothetical protein